MSPVDWQIIADDIKANYDKYKAEGGPSWKSFELNNNNLGNKLQGIAYVKIDARACRLVVTDNYMTIYNAKRREDSNPAGTNPFVKNDQGELLWENCTNRNDLIALPSAEYPKDPKTVATQTRWGVGDSVNYWYLAGDVQGPIEGCSFSFDTCATP